MINIKKIIIFSFLIIIIFIVIINKNKANALLTNDNSEASILMDMDNERILYENNINAKHLTASIAKIMTCIVAIENGDLNKYCVVDEKTINQIGSCIYLRLGDKIKLKDLLYGLMLRSGNDAAYLISVSVSKSLNDFVLLMNVTAKKIKMYSSSFSNPSGLDDNTKNYSTAYDMALLMTYAMKNKTFREITSSKSYSFSSFNNIKYSFINKHKLIKSNDYCIGGKTGYTVSAKRTLVSVFSKNNINIVVVTFNCGNDWNLHEQLFDYAINNFENKILIKKGILNYDFIKCNVTPYIYKDVSYVIRKNEILTCNIELLDNIKNENIIGIIKIYLDNKIVKEIFIYRYY